MAMRLQPGPLRALRCSILTPPQVRSAHGKAALPVPRPTPFVPDVNTFLTLIGRGLSKHESKFPTWESLFSLTSPQLRDLGIEPARDRRYLLRWRDNFVNGRYGIGGGLKFVSDGVAEVRAVEVPSPGRPGTATTTPGTKKVIVNCPVGAKAEDLQIKKLPVVKGLGLIRGHVVSGPHFRPVKGSQGSVATIKVKEGLWEHKRGVKIDGGERRRAEVLAKRRVQEKSGR